MKETVTIRTVAEAANCAVSTVSRALRDDPAISEASKQRIREAAEALNYRRLRRPSVKDSTNGNGHSRNTLADKRLIVVTMGLDRSLTSLPVVNATLCGLEDALSGFGLRLQMTHVPDLEEIPDHLDSNELDGVFLIGPLQGRMLADSNCRLLREFRELPTVWLHGRPDGCDWGDSVGADDVLVGKMAADFLADHGHQCVAFVSPKPYQLLMLNRETGFLAQAHRRGLHVQRFVEPPTGGWTMPIKPPLTIETVQHLVDAVLATNPRPTAVFAACDGVATGIYGALTARGVQVGSEMSIIAGNNDWALISGLHPALTTFDIQAHEIGRLAVRQMESLLRTKEQLPNACLSIEPRFVRGESVGHL
ncbi:LacI family DNA-binding transcriptional regulator [Symmachiella dynata]|uniref:LacI family DNA-binding transcriptional regulator n=1 Tax=Symmachiella dynata TaxID=2527995 RepID=UPI00118CF7AC|nr:LacI family DNA-binding transcriptional regulator [Symmachiella dynata]QDT46626.1 putative HTH-type transcriptional repressor ExuR [Symmachiella dynata]